MDTPLSVVENAYRAWADRDFAEWLCTFDPDVRWHQEDGLPYPGEFTGREAVADLLRDILSDWRRLDVTPLRWTVHGDVVVVAGSYTGEGLVTGFRFEDRFIHVWLIEDERSVEVRLYRTPAEAMSDLDRRFGLAIA